MIILFLIACTEVTADHLSLSHQQSKCMSRSSGSQPECWDEKDWEVFCERVACKKQ